ncbi:MAG TPA: cation diffusion facilitator family transporter [Isosphaeraceae bacterium]
MGGELYNDSRRAAAWGLSISLGLGAVKLAGGLLGGSVALVSDAAHSLVDGLISAALLMALAVAERPADREHPYGHARAESLAGQGIAVALIALALAIGYESLSGLGRPHPAPEGFTLLIAAGGAIVQEALYRRTSRVARRTGSAALLATAWDYRLDAVGSLVVLGGVAAAKWGGPSWAWADHAAAAVVAATILWVGAGLLWDNVQGLMDRQADPDLLAAVRAEAEAVPGVRGVETLRIRKAGLEYLVDIHIEVDPDLTVREGHAIAHRVKDRLIGGIGPVRDVLVHVEPAPEPAGEGAA